MRIQFPNMNINETKASTALAAKTARPCDSCLIKRARWFCAADDAFLCQSCDAAVHSANQLASRHQRLRLENSSCKLIVAPAWHQGFTKKARTPRQPKARQPDNHHLPLVPEMGSEDPTFPEENDEDQLLFCRVPVFDPYEGSIVFDDDNGDLNLDELLSGCDEELAEFAADVEGLLGTGVEEVLMDEKRVKVEEKDDIDDDDEEVGAVIACHLDPALDMELSWEFNDSESTKKNINDDEMGMNNNEESSSQEKKRMLLRLNYEAVIAAWAAQGGSPWADGIRPQLKQLEDEFMMMGAWLERDIGIKVGGRGDAGREARVSRYREKRRTRLFSKKIRYEVRKLNAEKRPRMKGRFVKRTTFLPSSNSSPYHLIIK